MTKAIIYLCARLISQVKLSTLKFVSIFFAAAVASGCVSDNLAVDDTTTDDSVIIATETGTTDVVADDEYIPLLPSKWVVLSGDHLWGIAGIEKVYNNSEYWPLLYKSNIDQIEDADLIYPGQVLDILRDPSAAQIDAAITHARTRGAWSLGQVEESDKNYLSTSP